MTDAKSKTRTGYKVLDANLADAQGFQFEIGRTYVARGPLQFGKNGFDYCEVPVKCSSYNYTMAYPVRYFEVQDLAPGDSTSDGDICVARQFKIVKELSKADWLSRTNGPVRYVNSKCTMYFQKGIIHRDKKDGPAIMYDGGIHQFAENGHIDHSATFYVKESS